MATCPGIQECFNLVPSAGLSHHWSYTFKEIMSNDWSKESTTLLTTMLIAKPQVSALDKLDQYTL